ncbi:BLUF domain-containing protein [uncultured Thalassolituus sp.]|uniref:BLUF domain-containing protein n=1 Tax=uncultured Thalassolituus sp. TaxID=285273 RepID=UPI00263A1483|nr:BLUF domain-containing protein [uncultured Thalassolituus sp.]
MLVRLTYMSRATRDMSLQDIQDILQVARENNQGINICGMLCYDQRYFLQTLEGERDQVNELFLEIAEDPRHDDVVIVGYEYIPATTFGSWDMGFAPASDQFYQLLNKLGQNTFNPADMTPEQAVSFLTGLAAL